MVKISEREKILLGYSTNSLSNFASRMSSDLDFSDVFGGPPRRSTIQEFQNERNDSFDSGEGSRNSWAGLGEKPVFGEEVGTRRRYLSQDFFDDIFRGDKPSSCSQSPRSMPRRDPFSSAPGSRDMSPSRPLPPMVEPFASPSNFSLPARSTNTEFVATTPVNQNFNSVSPSKGFNQTTQNQDVMRADVRLSYRPSPLSHQYSVDGEEIAVNRKKDGNLDRSSFIKDSKGSEVALDSTQFHFSIYKWASKGVPLVMSLRKKSHSQQKQSIKLERCLSANERVGSVILENHALSFSTNEIPPPSQVEDHEGCNDTVGNSDYQYFEGASPAISNNVKDQARDDVTFSGLEDPRKVPTLSKESSRADIDVDSPKYQGNVRKVNMRRLSSLFHEEEKRNQTEIAEKEEKESVVEEKRKPSVDDAVSSCKVNKNKVSQSFREKKDAHLKNEGTGRVKEFVNIFNKESSSKAKKNVIGQSQSSRWNDTSTFEAYNEAKSIPTEKHNELPASKVKQSKTLGETSGEADEKYFLPGKRKSDVDNIGSVSGTTCRASANEPVGDASRDPAPNRHVPDDNITCTELPQEINMQLEVEYQEEIQDYESKIRRWSKGKEGNIRALLSTLQHVLWPDSGWKAVPLVDIIEANAVKRAYQKALLRLHPDKLQQKGAAEYQKFIAQSVFEILQEAWDHFNSL